MYIMLLLHTMDYTEVLVLKHLDLLCMGVYSNLSIYELAIDIIVNLYKFYYRFIWQAYTDALP